MRKQTKISQVVWQWGPQRLHIYITGAEPGGGGHAEFTGGPVLLAAHNVTISLGVSSLEECNDSIFKRHKKWFSKEVFKKIVHFWRLLLQIGFKQGAELTWTVMNKFSLQYMFCHWIHRALQWLKQQDRKEKVCTVFIPCMHTTFTEHLWFINLMCFPLYDIHSISTPNSVACRRIMFSLSIFFCL